MAIEQKTADIKKYDDAIKLASLNAIAEKINKGDGRFTAVLKNQMYGNRNMLIIVLFHL